MSSVITMQHYMYKLVMAISIKAAAAAFQQIFTANIKRNLLEKWMILTFTDINEAHENYLSDTTITMSNGIRSWLWAEDRKHKENQKINSHINWTTYLAKVKTFAFAYNQG